MTLSVILKNVTAPKVGYWKHGGIVGVLGYGGGVIGRYSEIGNEFPVLRISIPSG